MPHNPNEFKDLIVWSSLSGIGGVVRFLIGRMSPGAPAITRAKYYCLMGSNIVISGFSGLLGALLMSQLTPDHTWHLIAAGSFGYLGVEGLEIIARRVSKNISQ